MAATVIPLAWPIAIEVLVSLIDIDVLVWVIDVLAWLAAFGVPELLELLEPQPAAANAAASGTIRYRLAIMHPSSVGAGAARSQARTLRIPSGRIRPEKHADGSKLPGNREPSSHLTGPSGYGRAPSSLADCGGAHHARCVRRDAPAYPASEHR
jgi:hypothetical protein